MSSVRALSRGWRRVPEERLHRALREGDGRGGGEGGDEGLVGEGEEGTGVGYKGYLGV